MSETQKYTLLLVEDDPDVRKLLNIRLQTPEITCVGFDRGADALTWLQENIPDLIILDYLLGDMQGSEFLETLHKRNVQIPFIVTTGHGDENIAVNMMKLGAWDYVPKDFNFIPHLYSSVTQFLKFIEIKTQRDKIQEQAERSDHRFKSLFNHAHEAIILMEPGTGKILDANQAATNIYGYTREELTQFRMQDLLAEPGKLNIQPTLPGMENHNIYRLSQRHQKGHSFPIELKGAEIPDANGHQVYVLYIHDMSEHDQLQSALNQSQKMEAIGQLAGGVAHDFNNQLTGIMGYVELMQGKVKEDERLSRYVATIQKSCKAAARLTQQLLVFARKSHFTAAPVDIHHVLQDVSQILEHSIDKRITIRQELKTKRAIAMGDSSQLQNAFLNLAINARDALPDGGEIVLSTEIRHLNDAECLRMPFEIGPGDYLMVSVTDNGIGMDEETQQRCFEPFYTTKPSGVGTGMGLAGVYRTIKDHGGAIQVTSTQGTGTTITLMLPQSAGSRPSVFESGPEQPKHGVGKVLVVDDEETIRNLTEEMLEELGYHVITCCDGLEAIEAYKSHAIDLIVLDMVMPRMSGLDTFRKLRQINPEAKIIIVSGFTADEHAQTVLNEGALAFLQKPFSEVEIARAAATALGFD